MASVAAVLFVFPVCQGVPGSHSCPLPPKTETDMRRHSFSTSKQHEQVLVWSADTSANVHKGSDIILATVPCKPLCIRSTLTSLQHNLKLLLHAVSAGKGVQRLKTGQTQRAASCKQEAKALHRAHKTHISSASIQKTRRVQE